MRLIRSIDTQITENCRDFEYRGKKGKATFDACEPKCRERNLQSYILILLYQLKKLVNLDRNIKFIK